MAHVGAYGVRSMTMKTILVSFVAACALVACGGGSSESGGGTARQGSHPDQGAAAPHIECGSSAGHHGSGCTDSTSGGDTTASDGTTAPATDADAGTAAPQ